MNGIVVSGWPGMNTPPSQHYAGTVGAVGVSPAFRDLAGKLVDGHVAQPEGYLDILSIAVRSEYARIAAIDRSPGAERCFIIDLWPRQMNDGLGEWDKKRLTAPVLLHDVLTSGVWQLYNCLIALLPWGRTETLQGTYPRP
jgi:hypothetical protein